MKRVLRRSALLGLLTLVLTLMACSNRKAGAGGRDTKSASGTRLTAIYGLQPEQRLGFLILVKFPTPGTSTSASSKWVGSATDASGATIAYEASLTEIEVNGTSFDFDKGRVFFTKAEDGAVEIHQLDLELGVAPYDEEIDRIAGSPEVEALIE
jgi:hypothetical protein